MATPSSCYDECKRCAETLFFDYHREHKLAIKVGRIFNTYGPRMQIDNGRIVSNFVVQALRGEPITIYGDGSQTRSFCYVDDTTEGLIRLMASPADLVGPVNLGKADEFTVAELADIGVELTGSRSGVRRLLLPVDDPRQRQPGISIAKERLGWTPKTTLRVGLAHTIAYFDEILSSQRQAFDVARSMAHRENGLADRNGFR